MWPLIDICLGVDVQFSILSMESIFIPSDIASSLEKVDLPAPELPTTEILFALAKSTLYPFET